MTNNGKTLGGLKGEQFTRTTKQQTFGGGQLAEIQSKPLLNSTLFNIINTHMNAIYLLKLR